MPLLGFRQCYAADVESGRKPHTIRAYRKDGRDPKPGDTLYLYTGLRTKQCRKLGEATCTKVARIFIFSRDNTWSLYGDCIWTSSRGWLNEKQASRLARRDANCTLDEFLALFNKMHGLPFEGLLIHWGKVRKD